VDLPALLVSDLEIADKLSYASKFDRSPHRMAQLCDHGHKVGLRWLDDWQNGYPHSGYDRRRDSLLQPSPPRPISSRRTLRVGDVIHICGHTTDFRQKVEFLEVDHTPMTEVGPKDLKVVDHAREHDIVFKVRSYWLDRSDGGEHDGYPETAR
jgi:hypothetical protein